MSESKLSKRVLEISAKALESYSLECSPNDTTAIGKVQTDQFIANLPAGHTAESVDELDSYKADFIAGNTHAFGIASVDVMKTSKKLNHTSIEIPMGSNSMTVSFDRQKEYTNSLAKEGEPNKIIKFGVATTTYEVRGSKNSGELKKARQELNALAQAALAQAAFGK
jgi:hypothetical protein